MPIVNPPTMQERVATAIATGQRLHIGVSLTYVGGASDKFWSAVWAEDRVAVNFGRQGAQGQFQIHHLNSSDTAAKKMWELMRSKTGKGYAVADAAVHICGRNLREPDQLPRTPEEMMLNWYAYKRLRGLSPRRPLDHPELLGTSPRTGKQGSQVLLDLTSPTPATETLMAAAVADPTERFLPPLVMSRPDVPEEAKFLAALAGTAIIRI